MANGKPTDKHNRHGGLTVVPMPGFEDLAREIQKKIQERRKMKVDLAIPCFGERTNGEPFLRLGKQHIGGHDCVVITSGPGSYKMLIQLTMLLAYLAGRRAERIAVVSGYLPLSRSDKDEGTEELALITYFIQMILHAGGKKFDRIIAADLHAPQVVSAAGSMGKITEISLMKRLFTRVIEMAKAEGRKKLCILYPDDGAAKRYEGMIVKVLQEAGLGSLPTVKVFKRRLDSGKIKIDSIFGDTSDLPDATVLAIDDETATMGTQGETASFVLKNYGAAEVWGVTIHGVLCGAGPTRLAAYSAPLSRLFITDTIPVVGRPQLTGLIETGKLAVVSWADDLANVVYFHHWDISVRDIR